MAFGDEFALPAVRSYAIADFCEGLGFPRRAFARELKQLCEWAREEAMMQAQDPVYVVEERPFVRTLADYVVARADFPLRQTAEIPKFSSDLF